MQKALPIQEMEIRTFPFKSRTMKKKITPKTEDHVDHTEELRIISLCTGYGGLDEGLRMAVDPIRVREVALVEIEAFATANLAAKMEKGAMDPAPIWTDLKTFPARHFRGKVHGITGGYPCQPFSTAGKRRGTEDPRHLWPYIREIVRTVRPVFCFFENVAGHLNLGFDEVYRSLVDLGYRVEAGLFTAAEVGAPHRRERLFILAYAESAIGKFSWNSWEGRNGFADKGSMEHTQHNGRASAPQLCGGHEAGHRIQKRALQCGHTSGTGRPGSYGGLSSGAEEGELANPHRIGERTGPDQVSGENEEVSERHKDAEPVHTGEELADLHQQRLEGQLQRKGTGKQPDPKRPASTMDRAAGNRWPARPGEIQHQWEHPRTATKTEIKSAMGLPADGFDFREDLLRSLGNGVVPQSPEKAFPILLNRILNH